jgi:muconate cycloisomerase
MTVKISQTGEFFAEAAGVDLRPSAHTKLAMHTMQQQTLVILRLRCSDGVEGIGEATTRWPGLWLRKPGRHQGQYRRLPGARWSAWPPTTSTLRCSSSTSWPRNPSPSPASKALLDAQGKRLGLPVSELLGGRVRDSLEVAWTGQWRRCPRHRRGRAHAGCPSARVFS